MNLDKTSNLGQEFASLNTLLYHKLQPTIAGFYPGSTISSFFIYRECKIQSSICCLANEWLQWYAPQLSASQLTAVSFTEYGYKKYGTHAGVFTEQLRIERYANSNTERRRRNRGRREAKKKWKWKTLMQKERSTEAQTIARAYSLLGAATQ